jgi:hypothetical protein
VRRTRLVGRGFQAIAVAVVVLLLGAGVAFAGDDVVADVVIGTSGNQNTAALGTKAPGATFTAPASFELHCKTQQHADQGDTVSIAQNSIEIKESSQPDSSYAAVGAGFSASSTSIGPIPATWTDDGSICPDPAPAPLADNGNSTVTMKAPTAPGNYTVRVTYNNSTGQNNDLSGNTSVLFTFTVAAPSDSTPPSISYVLDPASPDGNNDWYQSNVTLTWTVTENESPSSLIKTGCADQNITSDQAATTYSCSATSTGGSAGPVEVTIKRDATAPTNVSGSPDRAPDSNGWYNASVGFTFSGTDATSGIAGCSSPTYGGPDGAGVTVSGSCSDNAGNQSVAINSAPIDYDATNPTDIAFVGGPAAGSEHYFGSVPAAPTCSASDATSGVASCVVTGYSSAVGTHTLTATATDNAGNSDVATRSYTVLAWTLSGYYQPVDMGIWNTVKGGSTVPLKFEVFAGPTELTSTSVVKSFTTKSVTCPGAGTPADEIEFVTTGGTSLRYDSTGGQFVQNWQTPKKPGTCHSVTMETNDGSKISANFILK